MQVSPEHLQQLAQLLSDTVSPDTPTRKAAENNLNSAAQQQGFLLLLLETVRSDQASKVVRQAAGVYFKNVVKRQWEEPEEGEPVTEQDKNAIKGNLVPIMISLAKPETSQLQVLIGDALATIAGYDFPERWPTLVDELVGSLTAEDFVVNNGVLTTAHSIFRPWRSKFRTNELYSEINFVLERFPEPYYKLFQLVDQLLSSNQTLPPNASIPVLAQTLLLLTQLFYDLNSQDLAPFFEEHLSDFMGDPAAGKQGWLRKYLDWERPELKGDDDDEAPGPLQKIRASICEISELFAQKYSEEFTQLGAFVDGVWSMLSAAGPGVGQDVLVSKGLKFLSVVVKMGTRRQMFENPDTLRMFCEKIILPNMIIRQHEEEMFEDDPNEYIRRDLEPSIDSDTRRQAATEFTRSLLVQFDQQITSITNTYIHGYLQEYAADPTEKWKSKDTAIYLLTSIASRGSTQQLGVTSTNMLVDVVAFFGQNVFTDLQAAPGSVHPILIVDAIKYLYTFRNQLTKEQLVSVLPLLVQHLSSDNYVIYSYAAITIERILFLKVNNQAQFTQADVQPFAENVLLALFANIEKGGTPEKIAENDYLMKCAMRVIITARQALIPSHEAILNRLVKILGEISRNPSNPKFNQYCFESVSALIRFVCDGQPAALPTFEQAIFGPVEVILQQDIAEFIPYILQILAQLLELHAPTDLPSAYQQLMGPLAHASLWEQRGNVPALARIWKAIIMRGPAQIVSQGRIEPLLAIFQRLANSKINDVFGFDIITALYEFVPLATMQQYTQTIFMVLLTRQQTKPSAQFTTSFVYFALYLCAVDNAGPDFLISALDGIQPGLFGNVFSGVVLKNTQKTPSRNRKVVAVGLTKILSRSEKILEASNKDWWMPTFVALLDIFTLPQDVTYSEDVDSVGRIDSLDPEETGFQSSFSKLGASEATVYSPVSQIKDEKEFASKEISARSAKKPGVLGPLIQEAQGAAPQAVNDFVKFMNDRGDRIA